MFVVYCADPAVYVACNSAVHSLGLKCHALNKCACMKKTKPYFWWNLFERLEVIPSKGIVWTLRIIYVEAAA